MAVAADKVADRFEGWNRAADYNEEISRTGSEENISAEEGIKGLDWARDTYTDHT